MSRSFSPGARRGTRSFSEFKAQLETMLYGLRQRPDIAGERSAEATEQAVLNEWRDRAAADLDRQARTRQEVLAALDRIKDGTYGICICGCEQEIPEKRLVALPFAPRRRECQERYDAGLGGAEA